MSLGRPISEFGNPICPKCGTVQESPGSTVCEQCGQDLTLTGLNKPSVRRPAATPPKPIPRVGLLDAPLHLVRRVVWAILSLLSLIWRLITLTLRTAVVLLVIGALVVGLSYVPDVRAHVPLIEEAPRIAKRMLVYAGLAGSRWLASVASSRGAQRVQTQTPGQQSTAPQPLTVKSTPPGATVVLNSRPMGKTPVILRLAPGTYTVVISRPGYRKVTRTITVKAGTAGSLNVNLTAVRRSP